MSINFDLLYKPIFSALFFRREFIVFNFGVSIFNLFAISIIDSLFDKLGEISGTEEFANRLDDLSSLLDSEEIDINKISNESSEIFMLFDKEVKWRKDAAENLMPKLEEYNLVIKDNIGLRLQSRLTTAQAKYVAMCNSIHRDISLNF